VPTSAIRLEGGGGGVFLLERIRHKGHIVTFSLFAFDLKKPHPLSPYYLHFVPSINFIKVTLTYWLIMESTWANNSNSFIKDLKCLVYESLGNALT
jgi:hypothetical protein